MPWYRTKVSKHLFLPIATALSWSHEHVYKENCQSNYYDYRCYRLSWSFLFCHGSRRLLEIEMCLHIQSEYAVENSFWMAIKCLIVDATAKIALALLLPLWDKIASHWLFRIRCWNGDEAFKTKSYIQALIVHKYEENIKDIINGIGSE